MTHIPRHAYTAWLGLSILLSIFVGLALSSLLPIPEGAGTAILLVASVLYTGLLRRYSKDPWVYTPPTAGPTEQDAEDTEIDLDFDSILIDTGPENGLQEDR